MVKKKGEEVCHWCGNYIKTHSKIITVLAGQLCTEPKYKTEQTCNITDKHFYHRDCFKEKENE